MPPCRLMVKVSNAFRADQRLSGDVTVDIEYKKTTRGEFILKQIRQVPAPYVPTNLAAVMLNEPTRIKLEASPTGADGKIYAIDQLGGVFVVKAGGTAFALVHQTTFGQEGATAVNHDAVVRASIAISGGCLFIRAQDKLYCVGK